MTLELDCSMGEGGGSVVRVSVALAAGLNQNLELYNIRANRTKPGLRAQHIEAIDAIKQFSGMSSHDLQIGDTQLKLVKDTNGKNTANVNIGTAGSIGLVAQAVTFYSLSQHRALDLIVKGGATHGKWAPSIEYIQEVTNNLVGKMNKKIDVSISKYGFFPRGGAAVNMKFNSHETLSPLTQVERGELEKIEIYSIVSKTLQARKVAERQITSFLEKIKSNIDAAKNPQYVDSFSAGTGLTVINHYSSGARMGCFVPGERKLTSEEVGELCAQMWKKNIASTASIDAYAADQLIVPMALAEGKSQITTTEITNHTRTNIQLVQKFTKRDISFRKDKDRYKIIVN